MRRRNGRRKIDPDYEGQHYMPLPDIIVWLEKRKDGVAIEIEYRSGTLDGVDTQYVQPVDSKGVVYGWPKIKMMVRRKVKPVKP
jgi:hypothetical protein